MAASKALTQKRIRQLHKTLAPIMVLPLVLTAITGSIFQLFDLAGQERSVRWLMALHKGHFGILNLVTAHRNCVAVLQMRPIGRLSQAAFDKSGNKRSFSFVSQTAIE